MAYIRANASGNYSAPGTWVGGVVPGAGDIACVGASMNVTLDMNPLAVLSNTNEDWVAAGGSALASYGKYTVPNGATVTIAGLRYGRLFQSMLIEMAYGTLDTGPVVMGAEVQSGADNAATYSGYVVRFVSTSATVADSYINVPSITIAGTASLTAMYGAAIGWQANGSNVLTITVGTVSLNTANRAVTRLIHRITSGVATLHLVLNGSLPVGSGSNDGTVSVSNGSGSIGNITVNAASPAYGAGTATTSAVLYVGATTTESTLAFTTDVTFEHTVGTFFVPYSSASGTLRYNTFAGNVAVGAGNIGTLGRSSGADSTLAIAGSLVMTPTTTNAGTKLTSYAATTTIGGDLTILSDNGASTAVLLAPAGTGVGTSTLAIGGSLIASGVFKSYFLAASGNLNTIDIAGDLDLSGVTDTTALHAAQITGTITAFAVRDIIMPLSPVTSDAGFNTTDYALQVYNGSSGYPTPITARDVYCGNRAAHVLYNTNVAYPVAMTVRTLYVAGFPLMPSSSSTALVLSPNTLKVQSIAVRAGATAAMLPSTMAIQFDSAVTNTIELPLDLGGNSTFSNVSGGVVPDEADVRLGVVVGATLGTLVVPSAATVLAGVAFDNGTTGTLDLATDIAAIKAKTDQLAFTTGNVHALPNNAADVTAIKAKTDQLTFTLDGVVADSSGVAADYTSRFNALDTVTAGIKAKTDQLTFTVNGVLADAGIADYTSRFNALDAAVAAIPTVTYTARFNSIDTDLDNLIAGGGVDFTPVLNAITTVNTNVTSVGTTASAVKTKTDQLVFTVDGVVADVSVSVGNVINYDTRFDALDLSSAGIKAKTDQLTFSAGGVNAVATVDTSPIVSAVNTAIGATNTAIANLDADLVTHDTEIKAQLTTIQNATGAIDLTPITTSLATINTNVLAIPTANYTTRFNTLDSALVTVVSDLSDIEAGLGSVGVDLTPVLSAVAGVQADTDALQVAVGNISIDLSPVTSAVAGVQSTANAIKAKTDTISPCDTSGLADAINALEDRFNAAGSGPVVVIPQGDSNTTTLFGYCYNQDGSPASGKTVTFYVQQASGHGALLDSAGQVKTSGATGLVTCVVPRGTQYVYAVQFGNRVERINGVDAEILEIPSIIARQ